MNHYLEAAFREACQAFGSVTHVCRRTMDDEGKNRIVVINCEKQGYDIAGKLHAAGLYGINRSFSTHGKTKTYTVTITCPLEG